MPDVEVIDGDKLGDADGLLLGINDGKDDESSDGLDDGSTDGDRLDDLDGVSDGKDDGVSLCISLGSSDGDTDGLYHGLSGGKEKMTMAIFLSSFGFDPKFDHLRERSARRFTRSGRGTLRPVAPSRRTK